MKIFPVRHCILGTGVLALMSAAALPSAGDPLTNRELDAIRAGDNCYHAAPLILPVYTCEECLPASLDLFAKCGNERDEDCLYYSGNTYNVECRVDNATCGGDFIHYDDEFCSFLSTIGGADCTRQYPDAVMHGPAQPATCP